MKKIISLLLAVFTLASMLCLFASASDTTVYVTICDKDGKLALVHEKITVTDKNGDGILTIDEALFSAHEAKFSGGAENGYATENTQWGISLIKLWGTANGGSYGYYVNDASPTGLSDEVKNGDYITAFVYTDLNTWSDKYSFFDKRTATIEENSELTLILNIAGFDANWAPVNLPAKNAVITIDGLATDYKTDENGKVTIKLTEKGTHVISAVGNNEILVPPAATVTVTQTAHIPETGDGYIVICCVMLFVGAFGIAYIGNKRYEI